MFGKSPFSPVSCCVLVCTWYRVSVHENGMWYSQDDKSKPVGKESGEDISHPVIRNLKSWDLQSMKHTWAKAEREKIDFFSVKILMGYDVFNIYKWGGVFWWRLISEKSNFCGRPENWRVKGEAWNMLDYPCALKFTLCFKATHNRNPIDKRREKNFIFAPPILSFNSWRFESILQHWIHPRSVNLWALQLFLQFSQYMNRLR